MTVLFFLSISCSENKVHQTKTPIVTEEKIYPGKWMYYPEDNIKCRTIAPMHAECQDIK